MDLKGRVAIVTGAVGTIGRGICKTLANEGMRVVVADLAQDECDRFAVEIGALGGSALGVEVNVVSIESANKMAQKAMEAFGQIDVLVNNAGVIVIAPLVDHKVEDFDKIISVNLRGTFLCTRAVVPHMIQKKSGRIINISSVAAKRPGPLQSAYAASKHGIIGLTQVWCQELGSYNITVNAVCPGFIESPMWKDHLSPALAPIFGVDPSELVETIAKAYMPLQRPQTSKDIGEAVAYLCKADNVSGQALVVDGGHAMW
jgi:NAD(P)-dependent dehydrogenase (short-subunit alcohol dehydrogenase family)